MNTIEFANTGVEISEMCLGTMMFGDRCDEAESARILDTAVAQGVTFIDTAAAYCGGVTEEILGRIIKGKRDDLFIGTKVTKNTRRRLDCPKFGRKPDPSANRLRRLFHDSLAA